MADLFRLSASEAAVCIRDGKLTSKALVRSRLERIDAWDSLRDGGRGRTTLSCCNFGNSLP